MPNGTHAKLPQPAVTKVPNQRLSAAERLRRLEEACAFSFDGRWIVSVSKDKTPKVWDASSGKERPPLTTDPTAFISACAFSPDGQSIVSASEDGRSRSGMLLQAENGSPS